MFIVFCSTVVLLSLHTGCTAKLQPCDVSWNKPFKDSFRNKYDDWLVDGPVELTKGGNRKKPATGTLLQWVKEAWNDVREETVIKSFKKTGEYMFVIIFGNV